MNYKLNDPPGTVTVANSPPTTEELAQRSTNSLTKLRRSLDGRSFLTFLNSFPLNQINARKSLADIYPPGVDASLDIERDRGGAGGLRPQP